MEKYSDAHKYATPHTKRGVYPATGERFMLYRSYVVARLRFTNDGGFRILLDHCNMPTFRCAERMNNFLALNKVRAKVLLQKGKFYFDWPFTEGLMEFSEDGRFAFYAQPSGFGFSNCFSYAPNTHRAAQMVQLDKNYQAGLQRFQKFNRSRLKKR